MNGGRLVQTAGVPASSRDASPAQPARRLATSRLRVEDKISVHSLAPHGFANWLLRAASGLPHQEAIACAVCLSQTLFAIALTTPIAASPVNTGFCQIWDEGLASVPWPGKYAVVRATVPDFLTALDVKWHAADGRLHVLIGSSSAA
jgi:hypothetical protein